MAEYLLKNMLGAPNDKFEVLSAGIGTAGGAEASESTKKVLYKEGIDASAHRSRPLTPDLVNGADFIFVMEDAHRRRVVDITPKAAMKTHLLLAFAKRQEAGESQEVPDPIGKPLEVYERVFESIKECVSYIAQWLTKNK